LLRRRDGIHDQRPHEDVSGTARRPISSVAARRDTQREAQGTALIAEGTPFTPVIAQIINIFDWQGKTFNVESGTLVNRITFFGISRDCSKVYVGQSWFDGNDCIILDYSETSTVAHWVRDEIRKIGPDLYLDVVYREHQRTIHFALQFDDSSE
jgi:hypothetical protein